MICPPLTGRNCCPCEHFTRAAATDDLQIGNEPDRTSAATRGQEWRAAESSHNSGADCSFHLHKFALPTPFAGPGQVRFLHGPRVLPRTLSVGFTMTS